MAPLIVTQLIQTLIKVIRSVSPKTFGLVILAPSMIACGGGSGGGSSVGVPTNTAPSFVSSGAFSVVEGSLAVGSVEVKDLESGSSGVSQSVQGGADASHFSITSAGALAFSSPADFESPTDDDSDNVYEVTLEVSDGDKSSTLDVSVTILDAVEGRVVDAPLSGSSVFIDLDGDSVQDDDEPSVSSDENGFFVVERVDAKEGFSPQIISTGGTDTVTGKELPNLALISDLPSDPTKDMAVTPLTTIVSAATTPEAKAKVLTALGISGGVEDLLTKDTWAAAQAGDESAKELQRKNQQVGLILQTASSLLSEESASKATDVTSAVAAQLVETATTNDSVDLTSNATIAAVLTDAVAEVDSTATVEAATITAVSQSVSNVNTLIADSSVDPTGDTSAEILEASQTTMQESIDQLADGTIDATAYNTQTDSQTLFKDSEVLEALPDFDGDGLADAVDLDDDGDGVADTNDAFPRDKTETTDTDGDGIGNNADTDDDGDGLADASDAFPLITLNGATDTDSDGRPNDCNSDCISLGMIADNDDDGDMVPDVDDGYPLISLGTNFDTDMDGRPDECPSDCQSLGMAADTDDDGDGVLDYEDPFPLLGSVTRTKQIPEKINLLRVSQ